MAKKIKSEVQKQRDLLNRKINRIEKQGFNVPEEIKKKVAISKRKELSRIDERLIRLGSNIKVDGKDVSGKEIVETIHKNFNISYKEIDKMMATKDINRLKRLYKESLKAPKVEDIKSGIWNQIDKLKKKSKGVELERLNKITDIQVTQLANRTLMNAGSQIFVNNELNDQTKAAISGKFSFGGSGAFKKLQGTSKKYTSSKIESLNRNYKNNLLKGIDNFIKNGDPNNKDDWMEIYAKIDSMDANEVYLLMEKNNKVRSETTTSLLKYRNASIGIVGEDDALLNLDDVLKDIEVSESQKKKSMKKIKEEDSELDFDSLKDIIKEERKKYNEIMKKLKIDKKIEKSFDDAISKNELINIIDEQKAIIDYLLKNQSAKNIIGTKNFDKITKSFDILNQKTSDSFRSLKGTLSKNEEDVIKGVGNAIIDLLKKFVK